MSKIQSPYDTSSQGGFFRRFVALIGNVYLVSMLVYLVLRLAFGSGTWWLALLNSFAIYTFAPALVLFILTLLTANWRDMIRLGLLCLLAIVWFGPFFQPAPSPAQRGVALTVITLNMPSADHVQDAFDWVRDHPPDVLLLQRVPPEMADGIDALRDILPEQTAAGDGKMTLSRLPIIEQAESYTVIDVDGREVLVYNVHFSRPSLPHPRFDALDGVPFLDDMTRYDEAVRNAEIRDLLAVLDGETRPYIVGGNFNMSQHSLIYSQVRLVMRDSFRDTSAGLGATWPTHLPLLRLDYVWHSRDFVALETLVGADIGADHLPLSARLDLR
ncbi:MAG: hypothetical protein EA396_01345 [Anaerolineaceae bacterium]|nr:MAG: hypothetical protein EA396_01345 [Anaerolineaceae bacterium]